MKVYVVTAALQDSGFSFLAVFSSKDVADKHGNAQQKRRKYEAVEVTPLDLDDESKINTKNW